jgi:hypothetical protein
MARFIKTVNGKIGLTNILVISVKEKITYCEIYKFSQTYLVMPHKKYRGKKNATVYAALANDWSNKERRAEKEMATRCRGRFEHIARRNWKAKAKQRL